MEFKYFDPSKVTAPVSEKEKCGRSADRIGGKIKPEDEPIIVNAYTVELERVVDIAKRYGVTRQYVTKLLKINGVDTARGGKNCRHDVTCHHCGKAFNVNRARLRNTQNLYCSKECWTGHLAKIKIGKLSRSGMYRAHQVLMEADVFVLRSGMVVHHVDGNDNNNDIRNLEIYATQGDHLRKHRGFDVAPVWSGKAHAKAHPECLKVAKDEKARIAAVAELTKAGIVEDFTKHYMTMAAVAKKYDVDVPLARLVLRESSASAPSGGSKVACPICGKEHKLRRSAKPREWAICCSWDCINLFMTNKSST